LWKKKSSLSSISRLSLFSLLASLDINNEEENHASLSLSLGKKL